MISCRYVCLSGIPGRTEPRQEQDFVRHFRLAAVPRPKTVYSCRGLHVDHPMHHRDILLSMAPTRRSFCCWSAPPAMSTTSSTAQASAAEPWAIR